MTTQNLKLVIRWLDRPAVIVFAVINVMVVVAVAASVGRYSPEQVIATLPTPALVIMIATPQPTPAAQVAAAGQNVTGRALVAYDAPDGRALGAIEQGRSYQVLASYGAAWLQANVSGSGVVWLRAADLLGVPGGLVDLAPTAAPRIVVVSAPDALEQRYQVEAASAPAQCYHSERQAMVYGVSVGLAVGDSCVSQQLADEQAAESAFAQMNAALQR